MMTERAPFFTPLELRAVEVAVGHAAARGWDADCAFTRDDMRQEALLAVWRARGSFDAARPSHQQRAYLARRGFYAIADALRTLQSGRRQGRALFMADLHDGERTHEPQVDRATPEGALAVKRALAALPPKLRQIAELLLECDRKHQVARALGVDPSMVTRHLRALRAHLEPHLCPA